MTIRDYLAVIRQRILVVLLTVTVTTSAAVLIQYKSKPIYEARSKLLVVPIALIGSEEELARRYQFLRAASTEAEIVKSTEVAKRVLDRLKLQESHGLTEQDLLKNLAVSPVPQTDVLEIVVTASHPQLAADLANAFPDEYVGFRRDQAIAAFQSGTQQLEIELTGLLGRLNELDALEQTTNPESTRGELLKRQKQEIVGTMSSLELIRAKMLDESPLKRGVGEVIQFANAPKERSNADLALTAALGLIIGIPLSLGLALLLDALSDTIKTKEEAEKIVGAEALGVIPLSPEWRSRKPYVVTQEAPYSAAAEAFRTLRINLDSLIPTAESRYFLLTSPTVGEGKTITSANLGVAFAEAGRSSLLISADLRRPRLHELLPMDPAPGFSDLLKGDSDYGDVIKEPNPYLYVIPSGSPVDRPDQLLAQSDIKGILQDITVARAPGRRRGPRNDEMGSMRPQEPEGEKDGEQPEQTVIYSQPNVVLLDAPSVLGAAEVSGLARAVDGVIMVLHSGVSKRNAAARAAEQIRRAGGKILGLVLVGVRLEDDYSIYPPLEDQESRKETARAGR